MTLCYVTRQKFTPYNTWVLSKRTGLIADSRYDLPSHSHQDENGVRTDVWYSGGVRHRDGDMPAKMVYDVRGLLIAAEWWYHGFCDRTVRAMPGGHVIVNYEKSTITSDFGTVWSPLPTPPPPSSPVPVRVAQEFAKYPSPELVPDRTEIDLSATPEVVLTPPLPRRSGRATKGSVRLDPLEWEY